MADRFEPTSPTARPFLEFRPLIRSLSIATDGKKLLLAMAGILVVWAGWSVLMKVFGSPEHWMILTPIGIDIKAIDDASATDLAQVPTIIGEPARVVVAPFASLFQRGITPARWFQTALMAIWAVAIWGIFGGAITRIAVVQAACDQRVGMLSALKFALKKASSLIGAPLTPFFGVALFAIGCAIFGLISRIPWGIGASFATIFGLVPLALGLVMALILVGLALGWPLMIATVAAEGEDAPDALSRSYSYVNQRLARYVLHLLLSGLIGLIGLVLVIAFARVVLGLADWGLAIGGSSTLEPSNSGEGFWVDLVGFVVHAWVYSYFWSTASIIYLILRRDVDGTPWHDVYLPEHEADTFAGDLEIKPAVQAEAAEIA